MKEFKNLMKHLKPVHNIELDKACFSHDAAYSDSIDSAQRTNSDKILKEKTYEIAINSKDDRYGRGLTSTVYKVFDKKINRFGSKCKRRGSPRTRETSKKL